MSTLFKKIFVSMIAAALWVPLFSDTKLLFAEELKLTGVIQKVSRGRIQNPLSLAKVIVEECKKHDIDPLLIVALIHQESSFRSHIASHKSAIGLMQIKHSTAQEVAKKLKWPSLSQKDLLDPVKNVKLGIHYLGKLKKQFLNNRRLFLTAYNNGPARLKYLYKTSPLSQFKFTYANKILNLYGSLKKEDQASNFPITMTVALQ